MDDVTKLAPITADGHILEKLPKTQILWEVVSLEGQFNYILQQRIVKQFLDIEDVQVQTKRLSVAYLDKQSAEDKKFKMNKLSFIPKDVEPSQDVQDKIKANKGRKLYTEEEVDALCKLAFNRSINGIPNSTTIYERWKKRNLK